MELKKIDNEIKRLYEIIHNLKDLKLSILSNCEHEWGIDGMHSNEYCKNCFMTKPKIDDETYYKLMKGNVKNGKQTRPNKKI